MTARTARTAFGALMASVIVMTTRSATSASQRCCSWGCTII
jgi:hypothetical protein